MNQRKFVSATDTKCRSHGSEPPIDLAALCERWDGHRDLIESMLAKFNDQAPADLVAIERSLAANDADAAEREIHAFKGMAGYIAANRLYELALQLEEAVGNRQFDHARRLVGPLQREASRCRVSIPQALNSLPDGRACPPQTTEPSSPDYS